MFDVLVEMFHFVPFSLLSLCLVSMLYFLVFYFFLIIGYTSLCIPLYFNKITDKVDNIIQKQTTNVVAFPALF